MSAIFNLTHISLYYRKERKVPRVHEGQVQTNVAKESKGDIQAADHAPELQEEKDRRNAFGGVPKVHSGRQRSASAATDDAKGRHNGQCFEHTTRQKEEMITLYLVYLRN